MKERQALLTLYITVVLGLIIPIKTQAESDESYKLGSGDTIQILVYGEEDLSFDALLGEAGSLSYPFLGEMKLVGLTVSQVERRIHDGLLGDYLIQPKVSVSVIEYRQFFINGEVGEPGGFPFQPGLTVGKAISIAGGFTERANKRTIQLLSDSDSAGKPKRVTLSTPVSPGDIITVDQSFF